MPREGAQVLEARELLVDNLEVIERAIRFAAHRHRLTPSDAEEFSAVVKLGLAENDYAELRRFDGRSSFRTFISIVVQRMARDYCASRGSPAGQPRHAPDEFSPLLAAILSRLPDQDRLILQLRFEGGMTVAQIARALALDQKLTSRRIEQYMREISRELERAGITSGNRLSRPSMSVDESSGHTEES